MIYQETITIPTNRGKRRLELCKRMGIDIYDSFNKKRIAKEGAVQRRQTNEYLAEYYRWANLTKSHFEDIFITPRILLEFEKKDVFGTTLHLNIQRHLEIVLAPQIYFLELIINEMENYKVLGSTAVVKNPKPNILQKIFTGTPNKNIE